MREIKFRVWDKEAKRILPDGNIGYLDGYSLNGIFQDVELYTFMQFTGLKDKNGKEIYEGDVINFGGLKPIEIVWRDVRFKSQLIPFEDSEPIHLTQEGMTAFAEVIGNIYENPEFLEKVEKEDISKR